MRVVDFLEGDVDVEDLLGAQLGAGELHHELVLLVDGEDAARVQVPADWVHRYHFAAHAQLLALVALGVLGVRPQLVPMLVQPLHLRGHELRVEHPRLRQCQPHHLIIIVSHSLGVDLQHLQNLLEHLFLLQKAPILDAVEPFIVGPLALFLQDAEDILLRVVLPILALKKYMAVVGIIVQVLDHLLEAFCWGWLGWADLALAAAEVGTLLEQSLAARLFLLDLLELLEDGVGLEIGKDGGMRCSLSFL